MSRSGGRGDQRLARRLCLARRNLWHLGADLLRGVRRPPAETGAGQDYRWMSRPGQISICAATTTASPGVFSVLDGGREVPHKSATGGDWCLQATIA
jgi:hypothetical protein